VAPPQPTPRCDTCLYDLTGVAHVPGWRCPECGGQTLRPADAGRQNLRLWLRTFNEPWAAAASLVLLVVGFQLAEWWFWNSRWAGAVGTLQIGVIGLAMLYFVALMPVWMVVRGVRFARELPMGVAGVGGPWRTGLVGTIAAAAAYAVAFVGGVGLLALLWWVLTVLH